MSVHLQYKSQALLLFPPFSAYFRDKFMQLNFVSAQKVTLNASFS